MNLFKRGLYRGFGFAIRAYERAFMRVHVWGREHITPGPKIYVGNHISSFDPFYFLPILPQPMHFIIGPGYDTALNKKLLDSFEQINALEGDGRSIVREAVQYLSRGDSVCIAPEGDIQEPGKVGRFHPGVARIYLAAGVPLVPIATLAPMHCLKELPQHQQEIDGRTFRMVVVKRGPYCISLGKPWLPKVPNGSEAKQTVILTRVIQQRIAEMVEEIRLEKFWL